MNETRNQPKPNRFKSLELKTERLGGQVFTEVRKEVSRWPALIALVIVGGLLAILSNRLIFAPIWFLLPVMGLLLVPAIISRLKGFHQLNHLLLLLLIGLVTLSEIGSIALLLLMLIDKTNNSIAAVSLLRDAALLWGTNVIVFALWYWQIDAGGPYARSHESCQNYRENSELLFPQLSLIHDRPALENWRPSFTDYLFVAFNTSTAFSPTDTPIIGNRIKWLSMIQSALSLVTLATLAARAINIL